MMILHDLANRHEKRFGQLILKNVSSDAQLDQAVYVRLVVKP